MIENFRSNWQLPENYWYIVCEAKELGSRPIAAEISGMPLVLFRGENKEARALLDVCPHRNVALSKGESINGNIQCYYHGWQFSGEGRCKKIPGFKGKCDLKARKVKSFDTAEKYGFIWIYLSMKEKAETSIDGPPFIGDSAYKTVFHPSLMESNLISLAENILDVPHTAFLHKGLFRNDDSKKKSIEVELKRSKDRVECQFLGEERPGGFLGRVLAPGGGEVYHVDRFILPNIAQVEYKLEKTHLISSNYLIPLNRKEIKMYTFVSIKFPFGVNFVSKVAQPVLKKILKQDAEVLKEQSRHIEKIGSENFVSSEIDFFRPHILKLLKEAANEGPQPAKEFKKKYQLEI